MDLNQIIEFIDTGNMDKLKSTLELSKYAYFISDSFGSLSNNSVAQTAQVPYVSLNDFRQYNSKQHDIFNPDSRRDKPVNDENGNLLKTIKVARIGLPEQKKIVLISSSFLGSPSLSSNPKAGIEQDMFDILTTISDDNKLDYKFKQISKTTMSERECAELWYTQPAESDYWDGTSLQGAKTKVRMRVLSPSLGDTLLPCWDAYGDMVAFGRYYETAETNAGSLDLKNVVKHLDVYTNDFFYYMIKDKDLNTWVPAVPNVPNLIKKIPVVYYSQPTTEWHEVQELIDRLEKKISNHADTNDYFDSPIVKAKGEVEGFSDKEDSGKVLKMSTDADVSYLTYDNLPASMKLETDNLISFIGKYTHTPDYSFDNVKGIGRVSGIALKLLFMDAHLKAADKEELFGLGVQRRINYLKAVVAVMDSKFKPALRLVVRPKFTYFLPSDTDAEVITLVAAYGAGIISLQSAVKLNPLVEDAVNELELIKNENEAKAKLIPPTPITTPPVLPGKPPAPPVDPNNIPPPVK